MKPQLMVKNQSIIYIHIFINYILDSSYSTSNNRSNKNTNKKRSICNYYLIFALKSYQINFYRLFLAHGSTVNNRTSIPIANIVVPREHF